MQLLSSPQVPQCAPLALELATNKNPCLLRCAHLGVVINRGVNRKLQYVYTGRLQGL